MRQLALEYAIFKRKTHFWKFSEEGSPTLFQYANLKMRLRLLAHPRSKNSGDAYERIDGRRNVSGQMPPDKASPEQVPLRTDAT